ncbi:hypothetical protein QBC44DRAFT_317956 [Cladorrhinum sp. PSN332]|nr:hypothetical protein QBC44DRAFT_317956 [Cladorrhinum sp. PSN332]
MLLPSALTCGDSSRSPPLTRLQSALFASPPASPPQLSTQSAVGNIFSTCRSLQSLLTSPMPPLNTTTTAAAAAAAQEPITPPSSFSAQLPTPPLAHAPAPPLKLRLRSRKTETAGHSAADPTAPARKRIVKRAPAPPARGPNKRRRAVEEEDDNSDTEQQEPQNNERSAQSNNHNNHTTTTLEEQPTEEIEIDPPHTPKRARIAPEAIPLGLERSDYHHLHHAFPSEDDKENATHRGTDVVVEADGEEWSTEDDRILVELVLEKLKLSKSEWQDCARSLGKDRSSLGRRWKSLMINGEVGLKRGGLRRGKIHGTWR